MNLFPYFLSLFQHVCFFSLHADKAKGLQINLSEALQGKTSPMAFFSLTLY